MLRLVIFNAIILSPTHKMHSQPSDSVKVCMPRLALSFSPLIRSLDRC